MKFIDECKIRVEAGKGGNGVISFRREFSVDKGGPDGGDGGNGGSIYFVGDTGLNTLYKMKLLSHIRGNEGEDGRHKDQFGASGADLYINVPVGTMVFKGDKLFVDITEPRPYLIAKGGRGGRGNAKFKSTKNTVPNLSENGDPGEKFELRLELKVLADVGFVGKPSAGKSTLLSKISNAKAKVGDYPFTTLVPQLGLVYVDSHSFVAADLPGLIAGAASGRGLGIEFLKHIERCRVVAHIIDFGDESKDPISDYNEINLELSLFKKRNLLTLPQVIVANKMDMPSFNSNLERFKDAFPNSKVVPISALMEKNLLNLKREIYRTYVAAQPAPVEANVNSEVTITLQDYLKVTRIDAHTFRIEGNEVEK